ncbi:MAG: anti-sigma factor [Xenococcaceae cyanobacterium]
MTSNFETSKNNREPAFDKSEVHKPERDRFELLSAYLDGEVTAAERRQVQQWLDTDAKVQQLYMRLLRLRQHIQNIPIPRAEQSAQQISEQVFRRIDRRQRFRRVFLWGGGAIAAVFVGAVSNLLPGAYLPDLRIAQPSPTSTDSELLMIALNRPVVEIPPLAVPSPHKSTDPAKE